MQALLAHYWAEQHFVKICIVKVNVFQTWRGAEFSRISKPNAAASQTG
jgi:hypothetical protein